MPAAVTSKIPQWGINKVLSYQTSFQRNIRKVFQTIDTHLKAKQSTSNTKSTMSTTLSSIISKSKIAKYTQGYESAAAPELSFPPLVCFVCLSTIHQQSQRESSDITSGYDRLNIPNVLIINPVPCLCGVNCTDWPLCNLIPKLWEKGSGGGLFPKRRKTFKCHSEVSSVDSRE